MVDLMIWSFYENLDTILCMTYMGSAQESNTDTSSFGLWLLQFGMAWEYTNRQCCVYRSHCGLLSGLLREIQTLSHQPGPHCTLNIRCPSCDWVVTWSGLIVPWARGTDSPSAKTNRSVVGLGVLLRRIYSRCRVDFQYFIPGEHDI